MFIARMTAAALGSDMRLRAALQIAAPCAVAALVSGCALDSSAPQSRVADQSKEAQTALVKNITPASGKTRVLRTFKVRDEATRPAVRYPPYNPSDTGAAAMDDSDRAQVEANKKASGWPDTPPPGYGRVAFVDLVNGVETETEYKIDDIHRMWSAAQAIGLNNASTDGHDEELQPEEDPTMPGPSTQSFSYGVDARSPFPLNATYPANHRALGRMGSVNGTCTGTLVGRRLVLTAAHCFVPPNGAQYPQSFTPRRDGASAPYGTVNSIGYWYDTGYTGYNCPSNYTAANRETCMPFDWAVMLLPDNAWPSGTPAWMGYWIPGSQPMDSYVSYHYGYPVCSAYNAPPNCVANRAYGDNFACKLANYRTLDAYGQPMVFDFGCDLSAGHSGGAVWSDYPGSYGPYVLGVATNEYGTTGAFPNGGTLMRGWLAGMLSNWRAAYP